MPRGKSKKAETKPTEPPKKEEVVEKKETEKKVSETKETEQQSETTLKIEIPEETNESPVESKRQKKSKKRVDDTIKIVSIKELTEEIVNMRKELEDSGWMCKALTNDAILAYVLKIYQSLNVWKVEDYLVAKSDLELSDKKIATAGEDLQDAIRGFEDDDEDSEFQQICEDIFAPLFKYAPDYAQGSDVEEDAEN